jgi:Zn-finger nucleic acid-binding protein
LTKKVEGGGAVFTCANKHGLAISQIVLRKFYPKNAGLRIWLQAIKKRNSRGQDCPSCKKPMITFAHQFNDNKTELDICKSCAIIWFDQGEYRSVLNFEKLNLENSENVTLKSDDSFKETLLKDAAIYKQTINESKLTKKKKTTNSEDEKLNLNKSIEKSTGFNPTGLALLLTIIGMLISFRINAKAPDSSNLFSQAYKIIGAFILIIFHNNLPNFIKHGYWGLILDKSSIRFLDYFLYFSSWITLIGMPFYLLYRY